MARSHHFAGLSVKRFKSGISSLKSKYDAIVVGAGHNGLVSAAYLQKAGLNVLVLEQRYVIGGAAVTEEIIPGFKFSRAAYLLSLLRPQVFNDLRLQEFGLKFYFRDPNYFTPLKDGKYLLLGSDDEKNYKEVAKFSIQDAEMLSQYESTLGRIAEAIGPILDNPPVNFNALVRGSMQEKIETLPSLRVLVKTMNVGELGVDRRYMDGRQARNLRKMFLSPGQESYPAVTNLLIADYPYVLLVRIPYKEVTDEQIEGIDEQIEGINEQIHGTRTSPLDVGLLIRYDMFDYPLFLRKLRSLAG